MSVIKCPHCGKELPSESAFCPYCMERLNEAVAVSVPSSGGNSRNGISIMVLITAVLVLAVIGSILLRFCGNQGNKNIKDTTGRSSVEVNEKVDANNPEGNVGQQEIQGETTDAGESQVSGNVTETPTDVSSENSSDTTLSGNIPVNGTTQGVTGNGNNVPTTENEKPIQSGNNTTTESNTPIQGGNADMTTEPQMTECRHNWVAQKKTVHHEEKGHYEDIDRSRPITMYRCPMCYKNHYSLNLYYTHFDTIHVPLYPGDPIGRFREQYTTDIEYEHYTERIWVVDREAYDEEVITGYKCSKCGKIR